MEGLKEKGSSSFWSAFGKFAAVVALIGTLLTIYQQLQSKFSVDVIAKAYSYTTCPQYFSDISGVDKYKTYYEFNVTNKGDNPLEEIKFESDLKGYYKIIYPDGLFAGKFEKRFPIENINPTYGATILVWAEKIPSSFTDFNDIRIAHKNGSFEVRSYEPNNSVLLIASVVIVFLTVGLITFVAFHQRKVIRYQNTAYTDTLTQMEGIIAAQQKLMETEVQTTIDGVEIAKREAKENREMLEELKRAISNAKRTDTTSPKEGE